MQAGDWSRSALQWKQTETDHSQSTLPVGLEGLEVKWLGEDQIINNYIF